MALRTDELGNQLGFKSDGLYLRLKNEHGRLRKLFAIKNGKVSKYIKQANLLVKANAIGFNYESLKMLLERNHKKIHARIEGRVTLVLDIQDIIDKQNFLWFKQQGFERQIFWVLDYEQNKVPSSRKSASAKTAQAHKSRQIRANL